MDLSKAQNEIFEKVKYSYKDWVYAVSYCMQKAPFRVLRIQNLKVQVGKILIDTR